MKKLISLIVPVYNEEKNIPLLYPVVTKILADIPYDYEIIFVNDGSRDSSWSLITQLAIQDNHVKGISFTRNFGQQMAFTAGYDFAKGDAIITMDCDLQDTPELIHSLINEWEKGNAIVYARRTARHDNFIKRSTAHWYFTLLGSIADVDIPRHVGDFRLIDKKVRDVLITLPERHRYLRGLVAWTGFKHTFVEFIRPERVAGTTNYTWGKLARIAFDGITAFSSFPLHLSFYLAMVILGSTSCAFVVLIFKTLLWQAPNWNVWAMVSLYFILGLHFLCLWILGEYVGRLYDQEKHRPLYIIAEKSNC